MTKFFKPALAGLMVAGLALAGATGASAQSYPRVVGNGENMSIDYGPMGQGTLVGGGRVMVTRHAGMDMDLVHLDVMFVQQPRAGFVPLSIGSGETAETIWVPAAMMQMVRDARARMPAR
jgi:hypothetical protein